jgi:hypothetical protein
MRRNMRLFLPNSSAHPFQASCGEVSKVTKEGGESRMAAGRTGVLASEPRRRLFWQNEKG